MATGSVRPLGHDTRRDVECACRAASVLSVHGHCRAVNYLIAALVLALQQAIERNQDYAPEFRIVWPDGEVRWIKGHARVLRDKAGQPIRMIGTNWDISEIKRRERNLACLSHLQQAIASLSSEEEVMRVTSERLADHFASV